MRWEPQETRRQIGRFEALKESFSCAHGVNTLYIGKGGYHWRRNCLQCNAAIDKALGR